MTRHGFELKIYDDDDDDDDMSILAATLQVAYDHKVQKNKLQLKSQCTPCFKNIDAHKTHYCSKVAKNLL